MEERALQALVKMALENGEARFETTIRVQAEARHDAIGNIRGNKT